LLILSLVNLLFITRHLNRRTQAKAPSHEPPQAQLPVHPAVASQVNLLRETRALWKTLPLFGKPLEAHFDDLDPQYAPLVRVWLVLLVACGLWLVASVPVEMLLFTVVYDLDVDVDVDLYSEANRLCSLLNRF
jgi:hypothetical protein